MEQYMFRKSDFNGDISKWDVSSVENMYVSDKEQEPTHSTIVQCEQERALHVN